MSPQMLHCRITHPRDGQMHTHTVIFLHGRGDTADNFSETINDSTDSHGRTLQDNLPSVRWVFPSSQLRVLARWPVESISQWFDTWDICNLADREELQQPGLKKSVASIRAIAEQEVARHLGGRWDRLILAGISQGGATAVHTLLNLNLPSGHTRLGGLLGFSCRFPFPGRTLAETRAVLGLDDVPEHDQVVRNTPVMIQHCTNDPLVRVEIGRQTRDTLQRFGAPVTWREYPRGGHWIQSPDGIDDSVAWLKEHVFAAGES
ncbi:Alpha/Beta hydrolase protein [Apodospora peruviana]|uniref:Alpha/Beta hydrolase protein n=1 Tax=Apodospora peruviana TaxID=516989 RepID=A0AAE0HVR4_9PEZI|nr:Alpha/Beta hydrolase protein [Apodospora peruviana]